MRKILFRGKRIDNGKWVEGHFVQNENETYIFEQEQVEKGICAGGCLDWCQMTEVDPTTIGQDTELEDRDGKRIFEGDIVRSIFTRRNYPVCFGEYTYTKGYGNEESACGWYTNGFDYDYYMAIGNTKKWAVVVGNIHDNPELMKTED